MSVEHPYLKMGIPFHIHGQINRADCELVQRLLDEAVPGYDTLELGTMYGGSAFLGARAARQHGRRHWLVDPFGRPEGIPGEPSMMVAFTALAVEGLHEWCVWYPGTSVDLGRTLPPGERFGAIFIDGSHTAEWAALDFDFARARLAPGGILGWHDLDNPLATGEVYERYTAMVRSLMAAGGWEQVARLVDGSVELYRKAELEPAT